jgi:hypothetical protein
LRVSDVAEREPAAGDDTALPPTESPAAAPATVGTGSALALGCIVAVVALVLLALAARWLAGAW